MSDSGLKWYERLDILRKQAAKMKKSPEDVIRDETKGDIKQFKVAYFAYLRDLHIEKENEKWNIQNDEVKRVTSEIQRIKKQQEKNPRYKQDYLNQLTKELEDAESARRVTYEIIKELENTFESSVDAYRSKISNSYKTWPKSRSRSRSSKSKPKTRKRSRSRSKPKTRKRSRTKSKPKSRQRVNSRRSRFRRR